MLTPSFGGLMETQLLKAGKLNTAQITRFISEPTNFKPNKKPCCIDLVITNQPSLILDSGTRRSSDPHCHCQIKYCKVNFRIPPPHHLKGRFGIQKSMNSCIICLLE